jgi:hypothetical protein
MPIVMRENREAAPSNGLWTFAWKKDFTPLVWAIAAHMFMLLVYFHLSRIHGLHNNCNLWLKPVRCLRLKTRVAFDCVQLRSVHKSTTVVTLSLEGFDIVCLTSCASIGFRGCEILFYILFLVNCDWFEETTKLEESCAWRKTQKKWNDWKCKWNNVLRWLLLNVLQETFI